MYKQDGANQSYDQMQYFCFEEGEQEVLVETVGEMRDYNLAQHNDFVDRMNLYAQHIRNINSIPSDENKKER